MNALKPCPFCGGEATENRDISNSIYCKKCFAEIDTDCVDWNIRPIEDALQSRIAELEAENDQLTADSTDERQDDKWIPVSERLPEKQKLTIGFTDNSAYVFFEIVNDDEMGLVMYPYQNRKGTVTHWMPLPESPNDTQTQTIVYGKEREE